MLNKYRKEIDKLDKKIVKLFEKRMDVSQKVGEYKRENGLEIFCPQREKAVIEKRLSYVKNKKYCSFISPLFEEVMRLSRSLQATVKKDDIQRTSSYLNLEDENIKLVYPGILGSYSGEALLKSFPDAKHVANTETFLQTAKMVSSGEVDIGILPFENNSSGAIADTLDLIMSENLYVVGEVYLDIRHCLMGLKDTEIEDIKEIYSHNQGFLQSSRFLKTLGDVKTIPIENTAFAAKYVSECCDKTKAAIASRLAAKTYGLKILQEDINENLFNTTRFVIVSNKLVLNENCNKISAAFTTGDKSGALCDVLAVFAKHGINLLHIESRPLKESDFSYIFYIDFEGNLESSKVKAALFEAEQIGAKLHIIGNYVKQNTKD